MHIDQKKKNTIFKLSKKNIYLIIYLLTFFIISLILLKNYVNGDQEYYIALYEQFKITNFNDVNIVAFDYVSSNEPISAHLLWIGAQIGLPKNIFISILNVIFILGVILVLKKYNCPWYIYFLIVFNFYFIVLITAAERLKIAYILLTYAALFRGKIGILLLLLSPFAHLQSTFFILFAILLKYFEHIKKSKKNFFLSKNFYKFALGTLLIFLFIYILLMDPILFKTEKYLTQYSLKEVFYYEYSKTLPFFMLLTIGTLISKNSSRFFLCFLPMIIPTLILDGSRINMISYTLFFYILMTEFKVGHKFNICILIYLALKSLLFIKNIFVHGNGFGGFLF